ncbi:MAG: quinone-dependent dihydroorotate dehydrogenase [Flavobacteriales bacterium]|jgi:dihydroorotate dehydrogenase|nr:quinone-dependent dihydroorotate dehydrogenase [Flavobacteriales bacterium]NCG30827.1 quinone-dependent dihydroorotate dehydrogenase [Bacteroidota bacterium]MBT4704110.1 quinone-dependent dihydroorotate dehydrogenase [Flavobacteriales bacterium]MBT4930757.1 quinone-dependent dihydroorotate dehydrogenase [Flavobacteriales bacterium]MBT5132090.1 quinone-dependent dihydroorotate dehydrogenase [Flavobacteriales bacterium]
MYKSLVRPILYSLPPEKAHYFTSGWLKRAHSLGMGSIIRSLFDFQNTKLETEAFGLKFPNPVGLAAGFDKDARWIDELASLGFGFVEIGTLTPKAQPGNEKPRLFRLLEDDALINRMGFNNGGVDEAVERIKRSHTKVPVGGNIGKNKVTPNEEAVSDYLYSFKALYDHVDYFAVNVSSPNTPGLRELQGKDELKKIFNSLFEHREKQTKKKSVLLKIAPDLNENQLSDIISLVKEISIDGLIATNTTLNRDGLRSENKNESGGLSGIPVRSRSTEVIRFIHQESGKSIPIIGVGGIHSSQDAQEKLDAGAKLVQLYTGFIYEGPGLVKKINRSLV